MADHAITSAAPAVVTDGGLPRLRVRLRAPGTLVRLFRAWVNRRVCGHHWHATGSNVRDWHCCHCPVTRDELPTANGRACTRPRLSVGGPLSA